MTKNLTNRVYLEGKLFSFRLDECKPLEGFLDDFLKIIIDLENIEVIIDNEDHGYIDIECSSTFVQTFC